MLVPPKRLFDVVDMRVRLYDDIQNDVEEKGYVAVSHVWGNQGMYNADTLGIVDGVDWNVPLSSLGKMLRLKNAMACFGKRYCWWDVLCMNQDRQDEINLEIPFMGDYYSGASLTLVLSDERYFMSEKFLKWYVMLYNILKTQKEFLTPEEESYLRSESSPIADFYKGKWFERVWTYQEAVLSREIILVGTNGVYVNLSCMNIVATPTAYGTMYLSTNAMIEASKLRGSRESYVAKTLRLTDVLKHISFRECYKIHDRFYGAFGVLGYKDFIVDYDMDIDDLNKYVAQHAYSKGDISWMTVGKSFRTGFVQPMYERFTRVGDEWEKVSDDDSIVLEDGTLYMEVAEIGTVLRSEKYYSYRDESPEDIMRWIVSVSKNWGVSNFEIIFVILGHNAAEREPMREMVKYLDEFAEGMPLEHVAGLRSALFCCGNNHERSGIYGRSSDVCKVYDRVSNAIIAAFNGMMLCIENLGPQYTIIKMRTASNDEYLLIVSGNADVGDKVMVPKIKDSRTKRLGIITSNYPKRKGVCLVSEINIKEKWEDCDYVFCGYPL
jgi:hypothetical protein